MKKVCLTCKKIFNKTYNESVKSFTERRKYCSVVCMNKYRSGKPSCSPNTAFKKGNTTYSSIDTRKKITGEENNKWRGGVTPKNEKIRKSPEYKKWRQQVFFRDDFTCQACGQHGGNLNADHVMPFALYEDLRFEVLNGRTLCVPCHRKTDTYGRLDLLKI